MTSGKAKVEGIRAPRGMADAMPEDMPWVRLLEDSARRAFALYGYREARTPLFEETRLFVRGIGEATDIVEKEMYTFGEGEESITLRPEATACTVRAYLEHGLDKTGGLCKFYYIGPMFRRERPQAGRMREFYQLGVEVLGSYEPSVDAETMLCAMDVFRGVGLEDCILKVNSIGCPRCRGDYREVLRKLLEPQLKKMCPDCQSRFGRNVFRLLDCKRDGCREIAARTPPMREHLDADCRAHFEAVLGQLQAAGQEYSVDDHLVRGFDYYTRTVYEITNPILGARDAVAGGGRYDNLVGDIGGPPTGAAGFAIGEVPTLLALRKQHQDSLPVEPSPRVFVVATEDSCRATAFRLTQTLRQAGIAAETDLQKRSAKAQMRAAGRESKFAVIVGPAEIAGGAYTIKDMSAGDERKAPETTLVQVLLEALRQ